MLGLQVRPLSVLCPALEVGLKCSKWVFSLTRVRPAKHWSRLLGMLGDHQFSGVRIRSSDTDRVCMYECVCSGGWSQSVPCFQPPALFSAS